MDYRDSGCGDLSWGMRALVIARRLRVPVELEVFCPGVALIPDIVHTQAVLHLFILSWCFGLAAMEYDGGMEFAR